MSRRHVRMFKTRFAALVAAGTKLQTIRPTPKRQQDWPQVGDVIDCRIWTGLPYRSKQERLVVGKITAVELVTIYRDAATATVTMSGGAWFVGGEVHVGALEGFARADGFRDWTELVAWFEREHGALPFAGILIRWEVSA